MKRRNGFTLVETLVVLTISALILSLGIMMAHNLRGTRFRDYLFWKEFHNEFELYESLAREHHSAVTIIFRTDDNQVHFGSLDPKIRQHLIKEPKNLSTKRSYKVEIGSDGRVNPATIVWLINGRPRLSQKFQFGWGMYSLENSE